MTVIAENERCGRCAGTGKVLVHIAPPKNGHPQPIYDHCDSCNGTGIRGNPGCALAMVGVIVLLFIGLVAWALFG